MPTIEEALKGHASGRLLPGERILGVGTARFELARAWLIATAIGTVLGLVPGLVIGLLAFVQSRESPYLVATNRRLFTYMGRPNHGIIFARRVIDLGTVRGVEVAPAGTGSRLTLTHADGKKTVLAELPRSATRGLDAASAAEFHDQFPAWLKGELGQLAALPPAPVEPATGLDSGLLKKVGIATAGVLVSAALLFIAAKAYEKRQREERAEARVAALAAEARARADRLAALGADAETKAFLRAVAGAAGFRPTLQLDVVAPPAAELRAIDAAHEGLAAAYPRRGGDAPRRSGYDRSDFRLLFGGGSGELEAAFRDGLGETPPATPVDVVAEPPFPTRPDGKLRVEIHVRPVADRSYALRDGSRCVIIEATLAIRGEAGSTSWTRSVTVPPMTDAEIAGAYSMRDVGSTENCARAQSGHVLRAVGDALVASLLGAPAR